MIRTIIIDDELNNIIALKKILEIYCLDIELVAEAENVKTGIAAINEFKPDLIFLDIEMPDGSGFNLLQAFDKIDFQVIFVTAFNQYAVKAFQFSAIDYILKPVNPELLIKAVHKVKEQSKDKDFEKKIEILLRNKEAIESLALPTFEGIQVEKLKDIIYCQSENNYTIFHFKDQRKIMVSRTLKEYDTMLADQNFFRIHQSYLINLSEVKKYTKGDGGYVTMSNEQSLDVSRRRKQVFLDALTKRH